MILSKEDLHFYLKKDKEALGISRKRPSFFGDEIWKFQIILRHYEYYINVKKTKLGGVIKHFWGFLHHRYSIKLGLQIPPNVFEYGLRINHYGLIVVNPEARVGKFCDIHQGVNIGQNVEPGSVPIIGDNCYIGPGVKLFGRIHIGNSIVIGANSVVNKSFEENDITIAGIPAKKVKDSGDPYKRK